LLETLGIYFGPESIWLKSEPTTNPQNGNLILDWTLEKPNPENNINPPRLR
jgi:hypothetical protein